MATYLYSYPTPLSFDEGNPRPGDLVFDREHAGQHFYLSGSLLSYPSGTLIGAWEGDGHILRNEIGEPIPIDPLYREIRPFGNEQDGMATDSLDYHHWMGDKQRHMQVEPAIGSAIQYEANNQPIVLTMEHRWDDTPGWNGWGWMATIEFSDPNRVPSVRAIGIYDENWGYLYTTGAFVWTDTGEQDEWGNPIFKWRTENPAGRVTANKENIFYALLEGAAQEGRMVLRAEEEKKTNFFWENNQ